MSLELTQQDFQALEQCRVERLIANFSQTLPYCLIELSDTTVTIHCAQPWMVDHLLTEIDRLRSDTWIVLGVQFVSIYFAGEEIYLTPTYRLVAR